MRKHTLFSTSACFFTQCLAQGYSIDTKDDIRRTAATLAYDTMSHYSGNETGQVPGILPGPPSENKGDYYWWEGGALMGTMIDYWYSTGDSSYNSVVMQGMLHQVGEREDYMPMNYTASMGNDDQGFWGMSAMLAAETKFPDPPSDRPQWLALAQAVWNTQADPVRHDSECGGGMRWQIPLSNNGYNYKNTIANGIFFNLGARLARYTGNNTYAEHAEDTWDWLWEKKYIDNDHYWVYDGAHVEANCTDVNKITFSYNSAVLLQGAAYLYNHTDGSEKWGNRVEGLLNATLQLFFPNKVAVERSCEPFSTCTTDMVTFKGYVHRWLSVVAQIAPFTAERILPTLRISTEAAIKQCTGGQSGRECGLYWDSGKYKKPATTGAGESMDALAAVSSLLHGTTKANSGPVTTSTGGTSRGDPSAGSGGDSGDLEWDGTWGLDQADVRPILIGDRVGAGILTFLVLAGATYTIAWLTILDTETPFVADKK